MHFYFIGIFFFHLWLWFGFAPFFLRALSFLFLSLPPSLATPVSPSFSVSLCYIPVAQPTKKAARKDKLEKWLTHKQKHPLCTTWCQECVYTLAWCSGLLCVRAGVQNIWRPPRSAVTGLNLPRRSTWTQMCNKTAVTTSPQSHWTPWHHAQAGKVNGPLAWVLLPCFPFPGSQFWPRDNV